MEFSTIVIIVLLILIAVLVATFVWTTLPSDCPATPPEMVARSMPMFPTKEEQVDHIVKKLQKLEGVEYHISYENICWDGKSETTDVPDEYNRTASKKVVADCNPR